MRRIEGRDPEMQTRTLGNSGLKVSAIGLGGNNFGRPIDFAAPQTPIEETLRALDDLVRAGKVHHIGCSNLSAQQVVEAQETAQRHALTPFVCCQDEYSLLARGIERELLPAIKARGLGLLPYF